MVWLPSDVNSVVLIVALEIIQASSLCPVSVITSSLRGYYRTSIVRETKKKYINLLQERGGGTLQSNLI